MVCLMEVFDVYEDGELQLVTNARLLRDIITEENLKKVFLVMNHEGKEAWIWIGPKANVQKKFVSARASRRIITDRRLSYRVKTADGYGDEPKEFKTLLNSRIRGSVRKEGPPLEILHIQKEVLNTPLPGSEFRREACFIGKTMYVAVEKKVMGQKHVSYEESEFIPEGLVDLPESYRARIFVSKGFIDAIEFYVPKKKENNVDE